jgi:hypothetical protein
MHTGKGGIKLEFSETAFRVAKITVGRTKPERTSTLRNVTEQTKIRIRHPG